MELFILIISIVLIIRLWIKVGDLEARIDGLQATGSEVASASVADASALHSGERVVSASTLDTGGHDLNLPGATVLDGAGDSRTTGQVTAFDEVVNDASHKDNTEFVWAKYLARAGVFAILVGLAFLLKLAIDYNWIGVMGRIAIGFIVGMTGLVVGQLLRHKYKSYSDVLIGGGIAVLYLTIFAAHYFYDLIGAPVALGLMVGVTALSVMMSVIDNSPSLARMGVVGGFLAPLLISIDKAGLVELLTYALILDLGVLAISFKQRWHELNFIAFVGTFILYVTALSQSFTQDYRMVVFMFTTCYFLVFLAVSVMHHILRKEKSANRDVVFITLNAIWYGVATYLLLAPITENFLGFYMLGIAIIYAVVAFVSFIRDREDRILNTYLTGLCVVFLTAAVPMQFDGMWITSVWFLEAVILFFVDFSLRGKNLYSLGTVVFGMGLFRFFVLDNFPVVEKFVPVFNSRFGMLIFIIVVASVLAVIVHKASVVFTEYLKGMEADSASMGGAKIEGAVAGGVNGTNETQSAHSTEQNTEIQKSKESWINLDDIKNLKNISVALFIIMNLISIFAITSEIGRHYDAKINQAYVEQSTKINAMNGYRGDITNNEQANLWEGYYDKAQSLRNRENTAVSVAWALYATLLLVLGFTKKSKALRIAGLILMFATMIKVFLAIWSIGGVYRVVSSIAIGVIALVGSFLYAKYAERIKGTIIGTLILVLMSGVFGAMPSGLFHPNYANADTVVANANDQVSKYQFKSTLNTNSQTGLIEANIPVDVLTHSDLVDIKIVDQNSTVVPYTIISGNSRSAAGTQGLSGTGNEDISASISDSVSNNGQSSAILDLGKDGVLHDSVNLSVSGPSNFSRNVEVYTADTRLPLTSSAWNLVTKNGYIYSYVDGNAGITLTNTAVTYPKSSGRYIKIVISSEKKFSDKGDSLNQDGSSYISINGAIIGQVSGAYQNRSKSVMDITPKQVIVLQNNEEKSTEISIDLGDSGIYTNKLDLKLQDPSAQFIRRYTVQGSDSLDANNWRLLDSGQIFNIKKDLFSGSDLQIDYPEVRTRFIRVNIFNKDDSPITFSPDVKLQSVVRTIIFSSNPDATYTMYYGVDSSLSVAPQYDFSTLVSYQTAKASIGNITTVTTNPFYKAPELPKKPWSDRNKIILNSTLVILVLLVGSMMYIYIRKNRQGPLLG